MSISTPFIQRPIATILLSVGLFLAGAVAYRRSMFIELKGFDEANDHVKGCGFPCAIRPQQTYNLALRDIERHIVYNRALFIFF